MENIGARFIKYKDKEIFVVNLTGCKPDGVVQVVNQAKQIIRKQPLGTVLILTVVTNANFSSDVIEVMKEFAAGNKPYVKASAIVGLSGLHKAIYTMVTKFSGRDIPTFDNEEKAKDWLISK